MRKKIVICILIIILIPVVLSNIYDYLLYSTNKFSKNSTLVTQDDEPSIIPTFVVKGEIPERSYKSRREFPYETMEFVNDETYVALKDIYENINFFGEFKKGDLTVYDSYMEQYRKLVENEVSFTVTETGEKYYLKDYIDTKDYYSPIDYDSQEFNPHAFVYYLFDMNEDGMPELCIWRSLTYIFKYDYESGEVFLWNETETPWEKIIGTRKFWWNWEGVQYSLCEVNEEGELLMGVFFLVEYWNEENILYLLTIPQYTEEKRQIDITKEMKEQAYFSEEDQLYMFRVTEEQFNELAGNFFEAGELAEEKIKEVSYTYDELFGNKELCEKCIEVRNYINK